MNNTLTLLLRTLLALVSAVFILIYFDEGTLFLATLLLSIVTIKAQKQYLMLSPIAGLWFALSIAPAIQVSTQELLLLQNGFIVQATLSTLFFVLFYILKPSIIGRMYASDRKVIGVVIAGLISGVAAGISSAALWQVYLQLFA